jgi:hypothetical protein
MDPLGVPRRRARMYIALSVLVSPVGGPHSLGEIRGAAAAKKTATGGEGAEASASGRNKNRWPV